MAFSPAKMKNVNGFDPELGHGQDIGEGLPGCLAAKKKNRKNVNGFQIHTVEFPLGGAGWASRDLRPGRLGEPVPSGSVSGPAGPDPVTKTVSVFVFSLDGSVC